MTAIIDLPFIPITESVHALYAVLPDPENVGEAFETPLLSSIVADILRYFRCTSGNGSHI